MASALPSLVIIGSGWAGFYLAEYVDSKKYSVTVISPRRTSAYTPLLASAACGLFNFYLAEEPVRSKSRHIKFIKANVDDISFAKNLVHCRPAFDDETANELFDVSYDKLVIAPGCAPNTFGTPGVDENALFVKNVSDAMAIRKLLFDLLEKASLPNIPRDRAKELLHIAIVGGGPTGIELCAELYDLAHNELVDLYPEVTPLIRISVYDVAPNILSAYEARLHEYASGSLERRDVDLCTNSHITSVDKDAMYVKEQGRVPYGMLIWATGNKHVPLLDKLEVRKTEKGLKRILTDDHLRVFKSSTSDEIYPDVFALGDAADIDGSSLPTTAEVAVQKARLLTSYFNDNVTIPFRYQQKALVSYIGGHDGVIAGDGHGHEGWTGRRAWLAWRGGSLTWTRSWRGKIMILLTWFINRFWGKEIARM